VVGGAGAEEPGDRRRAGATSGANDHRDRAGAGKQRAGLRRRAVT
jgi:hypothetical protein